MSKINSTSVGSLLNCHKNQGWDRPQTFDSGTQSRPLKWVAVIEALLLSTTAFASILAKAGSEAEKLGEYSDQKIGKNVLTWT